MRDSQTGRSGKAASSSAVVGNAWPGQRFWSQPQPWIQASAGAVRANARRRSTTSSMLRAPDRSASISAWPRPIRWAWASIRPGTTVAVPASMWRALGKRRRSSAALPTATRRPSSFQAMAVATGVARSWVWMRAAVSTATAWPAASAGAAGAWARAVPVIRASGATRAARKRCGRMGVSGRFVWGPIIPGPGRAGNRGAARHALDCTLTRGSQRCASCVVRCNAGACVDALR